MASGQLVDGVAPYRGAHLNRRSVLSIAGAVAAVSGAGLGTVVPARAEEAAAPVPALAHVSVPAGALSVQQRQAMVAGITKVLADAAGVGPAELSCLTVVIVEAAEGGWGVAGHGYVRSEFPVLVAGHPLLSGAAPGGLR